MIFRLLKRHCQNSTASFHQEFCFSVSLPSQEFFSLGDLNPTSRFNPIPIKSQFKVAPFRIVQWASVGRVPFHPEKKTHTGVCDCNCLICVTINLINRKLKLIFKNMICFTCVVLFVPVVCTAKVVRPLTILHLKRCQILSYNLKLNKQDL